MNKEFETLRKALTPSLSQDERSSLKKEFLAYLDSTPSARAVASPYFYRFGAVYAFALVLLVGGPVVFAAEHSAPRDPLYTLKTHVLEPAVLSLVSGFDGVEARVNNALVKRRLADAKELVARAEYDAKDIQILQKGIERHSRSIQTYLVETGEKGNFSEVLDASSELQHSLGAYERVLSILIRGEEAASPEVVVLLEQISSLGAETEKIGEQAAAIVDDTEETTTPVLDELSADTKEVLEKAESKLMETTEAETEFAEEAEALLEESRASSEDAESFRLEGNREAAIKEARSANEAAEQALILLEE